MRPCAHARLCCDFSHLNTYIVFSDIEDKNMKTMSLLLLVVLLSPAQGGPVAYGLSQTGCNAVWVACVSGAGGVAGVSTGGAGIPAAISACNTAQRICMATCAPDCEIPKSLTQDGKELFEQLKSIYNTIKKLL